MNVLPNTITFNAVLTSFLKASSVGPSTEAPALVKSALGVFQQMLTVNGAQPDATTYTTLVNLLARVGEWPRAIAIYDLMLESVSAQVCLGVSAVQQNFLWLFARFLLSLQLC